MKSLRTRLTLSAALLTALSVALAGLVIALRIDHQDRAQVDRQLSARMEKIREDVGKKGGTLLPRNGGDANLLAGTDTSTRVLDGEQVVAQSGETLPSVPVRPGFTTVTIDGQDWRSLVDGRLQVLQSLAPVEQRLHDNQRLIALVALVAVLVSAFAAWLVAGLVLRPLQRLRRGAAHIQADQRLPDVGGQREIAELAATLNGMLERLHRSTNATRRFTADAGHELRTPVAALGMDIETLAKGPPSAEMIAAMRHEHARMVALLDGLQQLARGDAEALPQRARVDVGEIAEAAVAAARRRHNATYELATTPTVVDGWADGIRLALDNLLDNAVLHGGDSVTVTVENSAIVVDDNGPGIAPADRERLKQRFARGEDTQSPGSGLGLALADQQARLHGGTLTLTDAPAGGLRARLTLT